MQQILGGFMLFDSHIAEKRTTDRSRFSEPVELRLKNGVDSTGTLACDLSEGGVRIKVSEFVPPESECVLHLKFKYEVMDCLAKVKWCQKERFNDHYQIGLQFVETDEFKASKNRINSFLNR